MGCLIGIPKRGYGVRLLEEGASLLERRRKFQSLIGLGIRRGTKARFNRSVSVPETKAIIFKTSSDPDLVKPCYVCSGWCQSPRAATEIRSGRHVTITATSIRHTRSFSYLESNTAIRKNTARLYRWLPTINLLSSTWMPMHPSAIPRMRSRSLGLKSFRSRLSSNNSNLTYFLSRLQSSSLRA
jgi:hypothetical protein